LKGVAREQGKKRKCQGSTITYGGENTVEESGFQEKVFEGIQAAQMEVVRNNVFAKEKRR